MKRSISPLVTPVLLSFALIGCSAGSEPAQYANPAPMAQPVPAGRVDHEAAAPTATQSAAPSADPTSNPRATATAIQTAAPTSVPIESRAVDEPATTYRVQAGDTLWGIAIAHGVSLEALLVANNLDDLDIIWAGQELIVPGASMTQVQTLSIPIQPTPTEEKSEIPNLPNQVLLEPMLHDWQKMNNCAPTTVAMALSFYGRILSQFDTAPALKGGPQDKNVSPAEIVAYLHDQGFGAIVQVNGNVEILQRLVSNQIPVIVEQWLNRPGEELTGHYRLVRGYDQTTGEIIVNDSYSGPRLRFPYAELDRLWRPFNRTYIPVYVPEQESIVRAIVGDDWDDSRMYRRAAETAQAEIATLGDAYAWFNLGSSLLSLGEYASAAEAFDQATRIGLPPRMFWYQFEAFEAYNQTHQYQRVLELSAGLTGLALEELHYQRGVAYEGLGQPTAALAEYQRAVELNPRLGKAAEAVARLKGAGGGS